MSGYAFTQQWTAQRLREVLRDEPGAPDGPRPDVIPADTEGTASQIAMLALRLVVPENLKRCPLSGSRRSGSAVVRSSMRSALVSPPRPVSSPG